MFSFKRILASTLTLLQIFGSLPARADVVPEIVAESQTVTVVRDYKKQPVTCKNGTDLSSGQQSQSSALDEFKGNSPAVAVAPSFNSANSTQTVWGLGWFSEGDQTMALVGGGTVLWTDGTGSERFFFNRSTTTVPVYSSPLGSYAKLAAVALSGARPTSLLESDADADGTTRLFTVVESTSILRLSKLRDRNGNTIVYSRDALGRLTHVQDVHGRFYDVTYNGAGYVATLTDSGGRTVTYTHDGAGRVTSETGPVGTITYQYDSSNRMTQIGYPNGGVHNYGFDSQGRVIHEDDGSGQNAVDYAFFKSSTTMTDALGHVTVYEFTNKQGYKKNTKIVDAQGHQTQFVYDANYAVSAQTDALGRQTKYINDARGNPLQVTDPAGGRTATNYHPLYSLPTLLVDPLNRSTVMSYDDAGDLIRVQDPMGGITRKSYDAQGHVTQDQDPLNHATQYSYKASNGSLASIVDPLSQTTLLETDPLSRVTKNTDPTNKATQYQYDAAGNVTQVTDAMGHSTQYTYAPGRKEKLLTQVTDANGHTTTFGYDAQGRQTSVTNALNQTKSSVYDAKGNLVQTTNARGQTITYTYDSLDRLTRKTLPEGQINYSYDAVGNVTQITHYNGSSIQNTYDSLNRLTQQIQTLPNGYAATIGYAYDAAGNRTQMTTPWGNFSYAYDANNRLTKIVNPQSKVFTFAYDAAGRRTRLNYPNGVRTDYTYDNANRVLSIIAKRTSDNVIVSSVAYTYDAAGNRTSMTDWEGTHSYGYDDLHRLTSATHPATSVLPIKNETFTYDAVGNRLADAAIGGYTYDSANRLTQNSSFTYTYDADGSLASKTDRATSTTTAYSFNSQNELVGATPPDGAQWTYTYDAGGRRIIKSSETIGNPSQQFVYDRKNMVAVLNPDNNAIKVFTMGLSLDEPLLVHQNGADYFLHEDGIGNVRVLSDISAQPVEKYSYSNFGAPTVVTGYRDSVSESAVGNSLLLGARDYDFETRLYNNRFRYLDADAGRFLQADPLGQAGGINLYLYAADNPMNLNDPLGLSPADIKRILEIYTAILQDMNAAGYRNPGDGTINAMVSSAQVFIKTPAFRKDCVGQSKYVYNSLRQGLRTQGINWTPAYNDEILNLRNAPYLGHESVSLKSDDPNDPVIYLDPLFGQFGVQHNGPTIWWGVRQ